MANRIRLRFSIRTLGFLVTLVCVYLGIWEATKRYGLETIDRGNRRPYPPGQLILVSDNRSPAPLVIWRDEYGLDVRMDSSMSSSLCTRRFYIWLFGLKVKLPFESESEDFDFDFVFHI
jgi:hypothetical protein